jgi:hypothetical protein
MARHPGCGTLTPRPPERFPAPGPQRHPGLRLAAADPGVAMRPEIFWLVCLPRPSRAGAFCCAKAG